MRLTEFQRNLRRNDAKRFKRLDRKFKTGIAFEPLERPLFKGTLRRPLRQSPFYALDTESDDEDGYRGKVRQRGTRDSLRLSDNHSHEDHVKKATLSKDKSNVQKPNSNLLDVDILDSKGVQGVTICIWAGSIAIVVVIIVVLSWWLRRRSALVREAEMKQNQELAKMSGNLESQATRTFINTPSGKAPSTTWGDYQELGSAQNWKSVGFRGAPESTWETPNASTSTSNPHGIKSRFQDI